MIVIGCDYHPSGQQVYGIDTESGEVVADRWIAHTGDELDEFYGGLPAGTVVGVESSGNMLWFERRLAQYGHRLRLGDAGKIRAKETRKQKHDRRDGQAESLHQESWSKRPNRWGVGPATVPTTDSKCKDERLLLRQKQRQHQKQPLLIGEKQRQKHPCRGRAFVLPKIS